MASESRPQDMGGQIQNVIIIGGGLAGMTVAKEVLKKGLSVTILEASLRLGGKAGSDPNSAGLMEDHCYHVFPGWYLNTRQLLKELGASNNFIDVDRTNFLLKPPASEEASSDRHQREFLTMYQSSGIRNSLKNFLTMIQLLPKLDAFLAVFAAIDLLSESWNRGRFLDRTSANGFLRGRSYVTDRIAAFQQQTVLQASSIPSYEVSAMTIKNVIDRWSHYPIPFYSFLDGSLQETFIEPFHRRVVDLGTQNGAKVTIMTSWKTRCILPGIPQIKPTFLEIAPSGIPSNIIPHSKGVKCGLIRSNSPFSYSNHRPAKPKIPKPLVYAQVSPLGTSFATP